MCTKQISCAVISYFRARVTQVTGTHQKQIFRLQVSVDDAERVEVAQGESQLGQVELDVLFSEHDFFGQPREEVATAKEVEDEVKLAFSLEHKN